MPEYEVGQTIQMDTSGLTFDLGTPEATKEYKWAFLSGDPDAAMDEATAEANVVSDAKSGLFQPGSEGVVRGGRGAVNKVGSSFVWGPECRFRAYPNTYIDDFSTYADSTELNNAWTLNSGQAINLLSGQNTPSGKALRLENSNIDYTASATWDAVSNRPNNGDFEMFIQIRSQRGDDPNSVNMEFVIVGRGEWLIARDADDTTYGSDWRNFLIRLDGGLQLWKEWALNESEPTEWQSTDKPVGEGNISVYARQYYVDTYVGYISLGFNGEAAPRPA